MKPKKYLNSLQLHTQSVGNERRLEMLNDILENGTFIPNTIEYKDIDESFKKWVESLTITSDEGKEYPTMSLFSNQRFSEYSQSWKYVDANKNLLLNFKTITRDNNPKGGTIQGNLWNIPGDRFYTMKKKRVLDDNGSESLLVLKMKQPVSVDLMYKVSIFTTKYSSINEFNTIINKLFAEHQCYLKVQGHFMPMTLESISDESQYNIDDRQFYSQSFKIRVMGYIITENDYKVEERPLKVGINLSLPNKIKKASIEKEEAQYVPVSGLTKDGKAFYVNVPVRENGKIVTRKYIDIDDLVCEEDFPEYYYKPVSIKISIPFCTNFAKFSTDFNFVIIRSEDVDLINVLDYTIIKDGNEMKKFPIKIENGSEIKIKITKDINPDSPSLGEFSNIILNGYDPDIVYKSEAEELETYFEEDEEIED